MIQGFETIQGAYDALIGKYPYTFKANMDVSTAVTLFVTLVYLFLTYII